MSASTGGKSTTSRPSRRQVLLGGAALTAITTASVLGSHPTARAAGTRGAGAPLRGDVFTLGVASGEPDQHSVVLWTRLAPTPLADELNTLRARLDSA